MNPYSNSRFGKLLAGIAGVAASPFLIATAQASTDYGPAIWNPPCNANYNTSGSGHKFHVIHDIEGYYLGCISMFKGCGYTSASIHYVVNGKKDNASDAAPGEITQMVRDSYYAWHARCWNSHCTGTEHEGFASNPAWFTEEEYQASAGVTRNLANKFGWAKDRNHIVGHGQKSVSGWPAYASANLGIDPNCNTHTDPGPYWNWTRYMQLVNPTATPLAPAGADVSSRGSGRLDVFVRGTDNALWSRSYEPTGWGGWYSLGGSITSDPGAVSWDSNRIDVFARATDGSIYSRAWTPAGWGGWYSIGGVAIGGPDVASWGPNRLDVFIRGQDNALWHKSWDGVAWSGWESLGGNITSDPTAVSWGPNRIDIFARGGNGEIFGIGWTGTSWSGWYTLGGTSIGAPAVASWGANRLDVFIRGTNNQLYTINYAGTGWSGWNSLGGVITSDPGAVSWGANRIDIFARGNDNTFWSIGWTGSAWSPWYSIGGH